MGSVFDGSPAKDAGIQPGDVVTEIDGKRVDDWNDLLNIIADLAPGRMSTFTVVRDNRTVNLRVRISKRADEIQAAQSWPGFTVVPLTDEIRSSLSLRNESGQVVVSDVDDNGPAAAACIRGGDIVRRVGSETVNDIGEFYKLINNRSNDELVFRIARQGREFLIGLVR